MNANVVYQVVKALPFEEQKLLLDMLQSDIKIPSNLEPFKKIGLTKEEALNYLISNVFSEK